MSKPSNTGQEPTSGVLKARRSALRINLWVVMLLVLVAAIVSSVLVGLERSKRRRINHAVAVLRTIRPDINVKDYDPQFGKKSADGRYQLVEFELKEDRRRSLRVAIPTQDASPTP
jgi:hypothetical protein